VLMWLCVYGVGLCVKVTGGVCLEYTENSVGLSSQRFLLMIKAAHKQFIFIKIYVVVTGRGVAQPQRH
jgi:hypothetical protein